MKVEGFSEKVSVKAADPLAEPPMPLDYTHSKMPLYNYKFSLFWDEIIAAGFARTIPWLLEELLEEQRASFFNERKLPAKWICDYYILLSHYCIVLHFTS